MPRRTILTAVIVAGAFKTYDSTDVVSWEGQQLPLNVATVCSWTWACQHAAQRADTFTPTRTAIW